MRVERDAGRGWVRRDAGRSRSGVIVVAVVTVAVMLEVRPPFAATSASACNMRACRRREHSPARRAAKGGTPGRRGRQSGN